MFIVPDPERVPSERSDEIEIHERVRTDLVRGSHRTWVEIAVATEASGDIAIFAPSPDEVAQGEADLAAEHLRRMATSFADRLRKARNAFRMARQARAIPGMWAPLTRRIQLEGQLHVVKPSLERMAAVLGLGTIVGLSSTVMTGVSTALAGLSVAIMGYALSGMAVLSRADRDVEQIAGLDVPITTASAPASADVTGMGFEGPYLVRPQISVTAGTEGLDLVPVVQILDAAGRTVRVFRSANPSDAGDVELEAMALMREADRFVDELRCSESEVRRLPEGEL